MYLPTYPIQDQVMIYHKAVCEALELPFEDFSPLEVISQIRSLMARPSAERERCARCVRAHITDRPVRDRWVNEILAEALNWILTGALFHDTLQDGEAGAATEEPEVKGNSMSISDKPSGIDG